jgi:hypothetical protein
VYVSLYVCLTTCRTYAKASGLQLKVAALKLAAAVVLGLNPLDRSAPGVQLEAWKLCERAAKVGHSQYL